MLYSQRGNRNNESKVRQHHSFKKTNRIALVISQKPFVFIPCLVNSQTLKMQQIQTDYSNRADQIICRSGIQLRFYPTVFCIDLIKEKEMCYKFITHSAPLLFLLLIYKRNVSLYMNKCFSQVSYKGVGEQNLHKKIHLIVSYQLSTVISFDALETVSTALNYFNTALCWQF